MRQLQGTAPHISRRRATQDAVNLQSSETRQSEFRDLSQISQKSLSSYASRETELLNKDRENDSMVIYEMCQIPEIQEVDRLMESEELKDLFDQPFTI